MAFSPVQISYPAVPTTVRQVRNQARRQMTAWGFGGSRQTELREDVLLVVSELVTNACRQTPGEPIHVRFTAEADVLRVAVWDAVNQQPNPHAHPRTDWSLDTLDLDPARVDDNGGHGLLLVAAVAQEYGIQPTEPVGKWIWASFKIT